MSKIKFLVSITVLIDVIGIGIVIPVLPAYVESFGATPFLITLLIAVYALFSFISSPFLGSLSDRIGRRPILITSIVSTSLGWLIFASAHSLWFLFLGRIIDGLAAGNISTAQSCLVDIAKDDKERTTNLGIIGASFGIGFILGPLIGGMLSAHTHTTPFWFVGILAMLNAIAAYFFLPETNKQLQTEKKVNYNPLRPILRAAKDQILLPNYFAWFFFMVGIACMQSVFALYLKDAFHFGPFAAGLFFALFGAIVLINQTVGLKHFWLKRFKEPDLELWMLVVGAVAFLLMSIKLLLVFIFSQILLAFMQAVLRVVMNSQILGKTEAQRRGEVLGILSSIMAVAMIVAPTISGYLYEFNISLPFFLSSAGMLTAFVIIYHNRLKICQMTMAEDV